MENDQVSGRNLQGQGGAGLVASGLDSRERISVGWHDSQDGLEVAVDSSRPSKSSEDGEGKCGEERWQRVRNRQNSWINALEGEVALAMR